MSCFVQEKGVLKQISGKYFNKKYENQMKTNEIGYRFSLAFQECPYTTLKSEKH